MNNNQEKCSPPSPVEIFLKVPLYESIEMVEGNSIIKLEDFSESIDCYCIECGKQSVFNTSQKPPRKSQTNYNNKYFSHIFNCSRNQMHQMWFHFKVNDLTITKFGQYPSLADIEEVDIQKYRRVLGNERYKELSRALGLASHGVGIGAYVYLRRIFEHLIEKYKDVAIKNHTINEEAFSQIRMDEKINLLRDMLPSFIVENRSYYSVLSKGIHSLSENECLRYFPVIKLGLELILDEELEKIRKEEKIRRATKDLSGIHQELKGN